MRNNSTELMSNPFGFMRSIVDDPFFKGMNTFGPIEPFGPASFTTDVMKTDITETDSAYRYEVEMPGFNKEDIKISVENGALCISAETSTEKTTDNTSENTESAVNKPILRERTFGKLVRQYGIPESIDTERIEATYTNGVLQVILPKQKVDEKKYITIN